MRPHLRAVTGLRFVAAVHVYLFHSGIRPASWLGPLFEAGTSAVSLFFVLSGFVLAYTYMADDSPVDRWAFWRARFARVYPVYLVGVLVTAPLYWIATLRERWPEGLGNALLTTLATLGLVQAWHPLMACQINCVGWSLSVEAFFYLIFPALAASVVVRPPARLVLLAAIMWEASLVYAAVYTAKNGAAFLWFDQFFHGGLERIFKYQPMLRVPEFILGVAIGRLFVTHATTPRARKVPWGAVAIAAAIAVIAVDALWPARWWPFLHNGLLAPVYATLIVALATGRGTLAWLLGSAPAVTLGKISYAFYILHVPIAEGYQRLAAGGRVPDYYSAAGFFLRLAVTVAVSYLVFRLIEEPARRALREPRARLAPDDIEPAVP